MTTLVLIDCCSRQKDDARERLACVRTTRRNSMSARSTEPQGWQKCQTLTRADVSEASHKVTSGLKLFLDYWDEKKRHPVRLNIVYTRTILYHGCSNRKATATVTLKVQAIDTNERIAHIFTRRVVRTLLGTCLPRPLLYCMTVYIGTLVCSGEVVSCCVVDDKRGSAHIMKNALCDRVNAFAKGGALRQRRWFYSTTVLVPTTMRNAAREGI